jgi:replicative superfamily II helicase
LFFEYKALVQLGLERELAASRRPMRAIKVPVMSLSPAKKKKNVSPVVCISCALHTMSFSVQQRHILCDLFTTGASRSLCCSPSTLLSTSHSTARHLAVFERRLKQHCKSQRQKYIHAERFAAPPK